MRTLELYYEKKNCNFYGTFSLVNEEEKPLRKIETAVGGGGGKDGNLI